ncbi:MAG: uroporphyrinogen-III synthase [Saprospiraceae bacterium]|nr:uroporphyrinogen-III synthase [Saprospiraceae bacterium]
MQRVFISRKIKQNSVFLSWVESNIKEIELIDYSLIDFKPVHFTKILKGDWYFFYSSRGVDYFFQGIKEIRLEAKLATIGAQTTKSLAKYGYHADFTGSGEPISTSIAFEKVVQEEQIVFVQAKKSRESVQKLLKDRFQTKSLVVYANEAKKEFPNPEADILVFTSPLNVNAYFELYSLESGQTVVAIGKTTARELEKYDISKYKIAKQPSEKGLLDCVKSILDKKSFS